MHAKASWSGASSLCATRSGGCVCLNGEKRGRCTCNFLDFLSLIGSDKLESHKDIERNAVPVSQSPFPSRISPAARPVSVSVVLDTDAPAALVPDTPNSGIPPRPRRSQRRSPKSPRKFNLRHHQLAVADVWPCPTGCAPPPSSPEKERRRLAHGVSASARGHVAQPHPQRRACRSEPGGAGTCCGACACAAA